ncbi:ABC transporter substrate-binding protein [Corynebacterium flavescens]
MNSSSHHRFTRRGLLAGALLAGASLTLSACGASKGLGAASGATRTVTDVEGTSVTVPEKPQRIVALSEPTLDAVFALGLEPVGAVAGRGQQTVSPYLMDKAGDVPLLGSVSQLNLEAIGSVAPDLILVDGTSVNNKPQIIEALRQIAPVVFCGYAGGDWRKNLGFAAEALNKAKEGEKVVADYDSRVEEMKGKLGEYSDKTFSIVRWQGNSAALILKELPAGRVLEDLSLQRPPAQDRTGGGHSEPVSAENIQEIDADYIFFGTLGGSSVSNPNAGGTADVQASKDAIETATTVPGFSELKAYRDDHIIAVDGGAWTSTGGPLLINKILDDITENLIG